MSKTLITACIFFSLLITNLLNIFYNWQKVTYPYDIDFGEGFVLSAVRRLADNQPLYLNNPDQNYFETSAFYPPFFYMVSAPLVKLFGVSFFTGRLISLISVYLSAILIFLIVRSLTKNNVIAAVVGMSFPLLLPTTYFGPLMRVDALGLFFVLLSLLLLVATPHNFVRAVLAAVFLCLAALTKYNYASLVLPVFLLFIVTRNKALLAFILCFSSIFLTSFFFINWQSGGALVLNTITYLGTASFSPSQLVDFVSYFFFNYFFLFTAVLFTFLLSPALWKESEKTLVVFYLLTQLPLIISIGKDGADFNYFLEPMAAILIVLGILFNQTGTVIKITEKIAVFLTFWFLSWLLVSQINGGGQYLVNLVLLSIIASLALPITMLFFNSSEIKTGWLILAVSQLLFVFYKPPDLQTGKFGPSDVVSNLIYRKPIDEEIVERLKRSQGPSLSYAPGFLVLSGKKGVFEYFIFSNLYKTGFFGAGGFLKDLREKKYGSIILPYNFNFYLQYDGRIMTNGNNQRFYLRREFIDAVKNNYALQEIGPYSILTPSTH